jgi:cyclopropane fatty-acyl-phospholipid synthase-like methyltransferase
LILSEIRRSEPVVPEFALVSEDIYLRSVGETRRLQAEIILDTLSRRVRSSASLLDVGCSFGFFLLAAREAGFEILGIEPDPRAYEYARRLLGNEAVRPGMFGLDVVPPRSFDVVSTLDVIEHIPPEEHEGFAAAVRAALTATGVWVIKVPSTEGLYYKLADAAVRVSPGMAGSLVRRLWQTRYEYPHLVYFSRRSLTSWLDRYGFDVMAHRYVPEVPAGTIIDRLTTDGDIAHRTAWLAAPLVLGVGAIESLRGRSDSLIVFARPRL